MTDYAQTIRRQWLRAMSRDADLEALSYYISERLALVVIAVFVWGVLEVLL